MMFTNALGNIFLHSSSLEYCYYYLKCLLAIKVVENSKVVLYQIGYICQLENFIQYRLLEYRQNVISVQHYNILRYTHCLDTIASI